MELIEGYLYVRRIREEIEFIESVDERWRSFHERIDRIVSVFAARGSGKTSNLVKRAIRSEHNSVIIIPTAILIPTIMEQIEKESQYRIENRQRGQGMGRIDLSNGKKFEIYAADHRLDLGGIYWGDVEVFLDEFDNPLLDRYIVEYRERWKNAISVISVGSFDNRNMTASKSWFKHSDYSAYIDVNPNFSHVGLKREDYQPSFMKVFMDHIPPSDLYGFI